MKLLEFITPIGVMLLCILILGAVRSAIANTFVRKTISVIQFPLIIFIAFLISKFLYFGTKSAFGYGLYLVRISSVFLAALSLLFLLRLGKDSYVVTELMKALRNIVVSFIIIFVSMIVIYPLETGFDLKASADIIYKPGIIYYYNEDMHLYEELPINGCVEYRYTNTGEYVLIYEKTLSMPIYGSLPGRILHYVININPELQ